MNDALSYSDGPARTLETELIRGLVVLPVAGDSVYS